MSTTLFQNLVDDNTGATAIEYGLIVALIALATLGAIQAVAGETIQMWNFVSTEVTAAIGNG
ncbi:MAG: Flp family type IVb pilin [Sphingomonadales bacterium]|nr:Flp family type IVb pilin [Sphingomonadales bacterium]NCQ21651.1 Flp family type IVb pilin [Sphingomonadales bacterium]NCT04634.1 Flp family type IVb pilin [Sphingomonadales bacterium]